MDGILVGFSAFLDVKFMAIVLIGTVVGVAIGALPGLSASMGTALLLPFTIGMDGASAIALLAALYCAAGYGGSITAILINTPGTPSAAPTVFDGYPMAVKGQAARALGMSAVSSAIAGIFSVVVMILAAPALARVAYNFGPPEYFALAVFALSMLASIGAESAAKNLIGGAFGVLLATVGIDLITGIERFTLGVPELSDGIGFIPVMIGMFAFAELLKQASELHLAPTVVRLKEAITLPTWADMRKAAKSIWLGTGIGTFVGVLPAEGGTVAAIIAYNESKRWSKHKHEFGHGSIEGVAGPEAANNSATGGAMVPTLALGIPGSATTAVILAALIMHGLRPGPHLFENQPHLLSMIFAGMLAANIMFLGIGLVGAKLFAQVTLVPRQFLWPAVFVLTMVGSYALNQSMVDVWIMIAAGIASFIMQRHGFGPAPIVMGLILGGKVEESLRQSLIIFDQSWLGFLDRPIALAFLGLTALGLAMPYFGKFLGGARARSTGE